MRRLALVIAIALAPSVAVAQHSGSPMGDIQDLNRFATRGTMNQWAATRPAALSGLSQSARRWLKTAVQQQAEAPKPVAELEAAIDTNIGRDIRSMAKSERIDPDDIKGGLLLKVLVDTHNALVREAEKGLPDPSNPRPWEDRIAESDANVQTAMAQQSNKALELVRD